MSVKNMVPLVGQYVKPDGWKVGECLTRSDWEGADFYLPTGYNFGVKVVAVNVTITGRTIQYKGGTGWVRVCITFVGDCEPDKTHGGWMSAKGL